ncbi:MAG: hypothetical protein ACP5DZ_04835, partial [Bacteroidales bacterium]
MGRDFHYGFVGMRFLLIPVNVLLSRFLLVTPQKSVPKVVVGIVLPTGSVSKTSFLTTPGVIHVRPHSGSLVVCPAAMGCVP